MAISPLAGKPSPRSILVNVPSLLSAYKTVAPHPLYPDKPGMFVEFGTSGHRGRAQLGTFNEPHILAITQAICEYREKAGVKGPLYSGYDTHALSLPAFQTSLQVLVANGVEVVISRNGEFSPTPVISRQIINHNAKAAADQSAQADGIVITPSHNGPGDGGFKYNPPHGGPADTDATGWIQDRANALLANGNRDVKTVPYDEASRKAVEEDFVAPFVTGLGEVVDFAAIQKAGFVIGIDPMGGAGVNYWGPIARHYGIKIEIVNPSVDPTFSFMTVDWDGQIRMDCSSPYAMAGLIGLKDKYPIAFGNDTDFDRHGIVTPDGLMNPNHYLATAIWYLVQNRPQWLPNLKLGKTLVSSSIIDRAVTHLKRTLYEVPVGFKWFVPGLTDGWLGFGGEESAGASLLTMAGKTWTTDKDGFALALLSAEILAKTGMTPSQIYFQELVSRFGDPFYKRDDVDLTAANVGAFRANVKAVAGQVTVGQDFAGHRIEQILTNAPGNNASMGGTKLVFEDGSWVACRASGTELKGKIYIESFQGPDDWSAIDTAAKALLLGG